MSLTTIRSYDWGMPTNAALHGALLDHHLIVNLWIAATLLTAAHLVLILGLALNRPSKQHPPQNDRIELVPLIALALLFVGLSIQAERLWALQRYSGADPAALQIEVTGMQFAWYFRYSGTDAHFGQTKPTLVDAAAGNPLGIDPNDPSGKDDFVTTQLVLPAGRQVDLRLTAQDVIHGFAVPEMRLKQNAIPGQSFHIHFTPTREGTYTILCTQVCGLGHHRMQATMRVVSPSAYQAWLVQRSAETAA